MLVTKERFAELLRSAAPIYDADPVIEAFNAVHDVATGKQQWRAPDPVTELQAARMGVLGMGLVGRRVRIASGVQGPVCGVSRTHVELTNELEACRYSYTYPYSDIEALLP